MHHEIAQLRHEERLVRAALAHAHVTPADGARARRNVGGREWFRRVQVQIGAQSGRAAIRVPRFLS